VSSNKRGGKRPGAGRPKGTPNKATSAVKEFAQEYTEVALMALVEIVKNKDAPHAARVSAANSILDRGHGKPTQTIAGDKSSPVTIDFGSLFSGTD